jgi:CRISPR system Cascade subunit CasB
MSDNADTVWKSVRCTIERLTEKGTEKRKGKLTAWGTATLSRLRRASGAPPGESADIWEVTIGALPDELTGTNRERAELAVHTALTLFGIHQQGEIESVSEAGIGFGKAVRSVVAPDLSNEAGIRRRFNALATASEFTELLNHARGLIRLIRSTKGSGFDYPQFAKELYNYQLSPEQSNRVRMSWGRDFYAYNKDSSDENKNAEEGDPSEQSIH